MSPKRFLSLLVALIMLAGLFAACDSTTDTPDATTTTAATTAPASDDDDDGNPDERSLITVSQNVMDAERCGNNPKVDYYRERFGLEYDYWPVNWGDWNEKVNTWIATNDTPDLIWWDLKGAQSNQYRTWARQEAFTSIPYDMIAKYPNLQRQVNTMESFSALEVDGDLYAWPSSRRNPPEINNTYGSAFTYRRDWAQAVGLHNEDDVYTWDEWKTLVQTVISEDPGENGAGNTAGIVMPPWAFPHGAVLFIGSVPAEGNETASYIHVDGEWVWPPMLEAYRDEVVETWQLYQDGLIWRDNMQFNSNECEQLFLSGRAFARYSTGIGGLNNFTNTMLESGLIENPSAVAPVIILDRNGQAWMTQTEDYWTVTAFSNKVDAEKMDRVLEFWDFLNSDEGILFNQLGFEGEDYEIVNGEVVVLWDVDPVTGNYVSPYSEYRFGEFTPATLTPAPSPTDAVYGASEWLRLFENLNALNFNVKPFDYEMSFFSATNKDRYGTFGSDVKNKIQEIMANPNADPAAEWDAWVQSMMPRVQPILDELNEGLPR